MRAHERERRVVAEEVDRGGDDGGDRVAERRRSARTARRPRRAARRPRGRRARRAAAACSGSSGRRWPGRSPASRATSSSVVLVSPTRAMQVERRVEDLRRLGAEVVSRKVHHLRHWTTVCLIVNVSRVTSLLAIASNAGVCPTLAAKPLPGDRSCSPTVGECQGAAMPPRSSTSTRSATWAGSSRSQRPGAPISERIERARYSAARSMSTPGPQPAGLGLPAQVRQQEVGDERQRLGRLGRQQRQQPLGLGVHDLAQHRVLGDRAVGVRQALLQQLGQGRGVAHLVGEPVEVVGELPADGLEQQLVPAARRTGGRSWPGRRPTP